MLSLVKIIFTVGVIYVVWYSFKFRARLGTAYKTVQEQKARAQAAQAAQAAKTRQPAAQDLIPCPKCGAYVAVGASCSCERA